MQFALSQEGDIVKLFIKEIYWPQLQPIFKDDIVTVKKFVVWMEASFEKNQGDYGIYYDLKMRKQTLPFSEITDKFIQQHPLKKYKRMDADRLKEEYHKLSSDNLTPEEIWSFYIREYTNGIGFGSSVVEAVIENSEFVLEAEWYSRAFVITFYNRNKLFDFLEKLPSNFKDADYKELEQAAKNWQSYASIKLRGDFRRAGNVNRMVHFTRLIRRGSM